ncbi:MAG TPA: DEAD/DEAH box helicase [Gemmataceae bacterium]|jgi:ATP-dependent RNA helicase RhlE|nr:DEAD/DEAH box helicase [Gemmataceae bacterium]
MPFKALGLHPLLVQATHDMRYREPTPIQAEGIPAILGGRDLIATAQTGTGKTAAFLLPILHQLLSLPHGTTQALVITPTRELAQQIDEVCLGLAYHTPLRVGILVGGTAMGPQEKALRAGVEVVIATPGRLLDHMRQNQTRFDHLHTLVLDEADRMLDMGFLPDLKRIIARLPAREQTLLFSATMPPVIAQLARDILRNPQTIQIGRRSAPAVGITQAAYPVPEYLKTPLLRHLLRHTEMPSVLVFTRTKVSARRLARTIAADGFKVTELHSNLTQPQRNRAMEGFRNGAFQVLVATNIAARGLDVEHITHVISFDVPNVPDDYVHRIGRTARMKAEGDAFVLVSPGEEKSLTQIERHIGQRLPRVVLPDFDYARPAPERAAKQGQRRGHGSGNRDGADHARQHGARHSRGRRQGPGHGTSSHDASPRRPHPHH